MRPEDGVAAVVWWKYAKRMTKRRITISLDDDILTALEELDGPNLSAVASELLQAGVATRAHQRAMTDWLDGLDAELGAPSAEHVAAADAVLDEASGLLSSWP